MVLLPFSNAIWIEKIEGSVPEKNEIVLKLQLFSEKFGVNDNGEQKLLFIREKTDFSNFSLINIDCNPKDSFSVRKDWIIYSDGDKTSKYRGHYICIENKTDTYEVELTIKISGDIRTYFMPFKFNNLDYPYDKYNIDLFMVILTDNKNDINQSFSRYKGEQIDSNYDLKNFLFYEKGIYPIKDKEYYGIIYETKNMQITRNPFEYILISIFIWILFFLLISIFYLVWNGEDIRNVIRLYMGFFIPSLFVFGLIQNVGSLAKTPLTIFGSVLLISTLLLCINILTPKDRHTKGFIQKNKEIYRRNIILFLCLIWLLGTFLLLILSFRNIIGYFIEVLIGNGFSILSTVLFIFLIVYFVFKPPRGEKMKKRWKKFNRELFRKLKG